MGFVELKILKLIYDYSYNNRLADREFVDKLVEIMVNYRKMDEYVKKVSFKSDDSKIVAEYRPLIKDIIINSESILRYITRDNKYEENFDNFEQILYKNISIAHVILHELEHAYQFKITDDSKNISDEAEIIRASFFLEKKLENPDFFAQMEKRGISLEQQMIYIFNNRENYDRFYDINPTERMAEINSYKIILKSLNDIKRYIVNLYQYQQLLLYSNMLRGYEESFDMGGICPTQVYLYGVRRNSTWENFDFYNPNSNQLLENVSKKYELSRRLTLGLPISGDEYSFASNYIESMK